MPSQINVTAGTVRKLTSGTSAGKYQATVVLGEGRGAAKRTKTFDLERDAKRWIAESKRNGLAHGAASEQTLAQAVDAYVAAKALATNTAETFRATRGHLIAAGLGDLKLAKLRPSVQAQFTTWMVRQGFSAGTVNLYAAKLSTVLRFAAADGGVPFTPKTAKVTEHREDVAAITPGDVKAIYEAAWDTFAPAILLGAFCGLRASEAAAINVGDVDWLAGTVHVSKAVDVDGSFTKTKTARSIRTIPVPPDVLAQLAAAQLAAGHRVRGADEPLATNVDGGRLTPRQVARTFRIAADDAGLPDVTFHALRKFFATSLLAAKVNPKSVARWLGDSLATMLSTYALTQASDDDAGREALGDVFAATAAA